MKVLILACLVLFLGACTPKEGPVKIIFDTDIGGDADDLGALAMLNHFISTGECELLGIGCWSDEAYAVPAIDAVNRYYGHPEIPIGVRQAPPAQIDHFYNRAIAENFPHQLTREDVESATQMYRRLLAQADDHELVIVTVGPLANIRDLIQSGPDAHSDLDGLELIRQKVKRFVIMGGKIPVGEQEWNFNGNMPGVTRFVLDKLDVPVVFSPFELGVAIKTGRGIKSLGTESPLFVGYDYFGQHCPWLDAPPEGEIINNSSFDQTAVLYAVRGGSGTWWTEHRGGYLQVEENGDSRWIEGEAGNQSYLELKAGEDEIATLIEKLMLHQE